MAQRQLVALQFSRVLGVTFLVLYAVGQLPGIFALPAGCGDVMVGLAALMVGVRAARNEDDHLVTLWNWLGINDQSLEFRCVQNGSSARRSEPDWR